MASICLASRCSSGPLSGRSRRTASISRLRALLIEQQHGSPFAKYEKLLDLGRGTFGDVSLIKNKDTGIKSALKAVRLDNADMTSAQIKREISHLVRLDHPNIIKLYEYYESKDFMYLILDFAEGGELFGVIPNLATLTEKWLRTVMLQITRAVSYCHSLSVIHKDMKPQNVLLMSKVNVEEDPHVVVADLGIAEIVSKSGNGKEFFGTLEYMAPEVYDKRTFGPKCDVWSLGCVLYQLLTGYVPFENYPPDKEDYDKGMSRGVPLLLRKKSNCAESAAELTLAMITYEQRKRPTSQEALQMEWFTTQAVEEASVLSKDLITSLQAFRQRSAAARGLLLRITSRMHAGDIPRIDQAFREIDTDNTGMLDVDEVKAVLEKFNVPAEDMPTVMKAMNLDDDGVICYSEFVAAGLFMHGDRLAEMLAAAFSECDTDHSGEVSCDELKALLRRGFEKCKPSGGCPEDEDIDKMFEDIDTDCKGSISLEEFKGHFVGAPMMTSAVEAPRTPTPRMGSRSLSRQLTPSMRCRSRSNMHMADLRPSTVGDLHKLFVTIDLNHTEYVSITELKMFWERTFGQAPPLFKEGGASETDDLITWDQFLALCTAFKHSGTIDEDAILNDLHAAVHDGSLEEWTFGRRALMVGAAAARGG
eukprot:NODE_119_length_3606_cov_4.439207.p1 GENE.NODE_119_length_3606_cov_4.439207~~NODE_119_length_3606_cov_4.439207.p1  ORF type:complete len:647 (+),score=138.85 NODE_119_length_3606_cov_4.439207:1390-3330(+)